MQPPTWAQMKSGDNQPLRIQVTHVYRGLTPTPLSLRGGRARTMHVCTAFCPFFSLFHFISPAAHTSALAIVCLRFFIIRYLFYRSLHFQMGERHSGYRLLNSAVQTRSILQTLCSKYVYNTSNSEPTRNT